MIGPRCDALRSADCDPVVLVGAQRDRRSGSSPFLTGALVRDRSPGWRRRCWAGPERVLVVPCDPPNLRSDDLATLLDAAAEPGTAPVAIATVDGRPHHSVGIWPGSAGRALWQSVEKGSEPCATRSTWCRRGVELRSEAVVDADTRADLHRGSGAPPD
ncbi:MAG: NTP transferase domain-containing protein [Acidimicrobiales bacterium]